MKTPKRDIMPLFQLECGHRLYKGKEHDYFKMGFFPATASRWKHKNKIRQLKHTIAILTERLKDTEKALEWTQKFTKCYLVRPDHWHPQALDGRQYTRKQWLKEMKSRKEKR